MHQVPLGKKMVHPSILSDEQLLQCYLQLRQAENVLKVDLTNAISKAVGFFGPDHVIADLGKATLSYGECAVTGWLQSVRTVMATRGLPIGEAGAATKLS